MFGVAVSSVVKWSQRYRTTGSVAPGKIGGHRRRLLEPHREFILERIDQTPHLTLHRLKDQLAARGVVVSHNTVWEFLRREGILDLLGQGRCVRRRLLRRSGPAECQRAADRERQSWLFEVSCLPP